MTLPIPSLDSASAIAAMTIAQSLVLLNIKVYKLTPAQGGIVLAVNGLMGAVSSIIFLVEER